MMIVLVHWFIDQAYVEEFRQWWSSQATPPDATGLMAEYLSEAVEQDKLPYRTDDLRDGNTHYVPFVNVGIWKDEQHFRDSINPQDAPPMLGFEVRQRKRTVLLQRECHVGIWKPEA
jgi:hypothetical protein